MARSKEETSPLTGVIKEENVVIDFGKHEGKSVYEISETQPTFYSYLLEEKEKGNFFIKRSKDKVFRLYIYQTPVQ
jgi:hypothetical protein